MSLRASRTSYHNGRVTVWHGDMRDVLAGFEPDSFDSCVTDPPYHFASIVKRFGNAKPENELFALNNPTSAYRRASKGFMQKTWDGGQIAHEPETWAAVLRVLKPGAHLVAFHAPKNWHRLALAIEDAGFEIRDSLLWLFGSGFPKSHDVSKAIDRQAGAEREILGHNPNWRDPEINSEHHQRWNNAVINGDVTAPATDLARQWDGFGTALKPAYEPIILARKPLDRGKTIAGNVMEYGTGALNIDACRVEIDHDERSAIDNRSGEGSASEGWGRIGNRQSGGERFKSHNAGRWPANCLHDGSPEVVEGFPGAPSAGTYLNPKASEAPTGTVNFVGKTQTDKNWYAGDSGSAARFFYTAKADADDRIGSRHPTVKPLDLIRWLCRLITPPKGHILDCFAGTGTTAEAALREGFQCTLIEREAEYLADIDRRMALALEGSTSRSVAMAKLKPEGEPLPLFAEAAE